MPEAALAFTTVDPRHAPGNPGRRTALKLIGGSGAALVTGTALASGVGGADTPIVAAFARWCAIWTHANAGPERVRGEVDRCVQAMVELEERIDRTPASDAQDLVVKGWMAIHVAALDEPNSYYADTVRLFPRLAAIKPPVFVG